MKDWLLIALSIGVSLGAVTNPYVEGPNVVKHTNYNSIFTSELDHNLGVWAPDEEGTFPVIYFMTGFAGLIDPSTQNLLLTQIASHGFVVLSPWTLLALPTSQYHAQWLEGVDQWAQTNLPQRLTEDGFHKGLGLDFDNTFLFGHSSGNHILVNYVKLGCHNVKAMAFLSPVDGVDPYGFIEQYCITPGEKLSFETPTLVIAAGMDGIPGISNTGGLVPPCAPDELSNIRFWNALNGRAFFNNATDFGHVDFYDPGGISDIIEFLHFCAGNNGDTDGMYRKYVAGQAIALFKGVSGGDCDMFQYLRDPSLMPIRVEAKEQGDPDMCPVGFCKIILQVP